MYLELHSSLEPHVESLLTRHKDAAAKANWSCHEFLPLEAFRADPRRHRPLSRAAYAAVEMALLTEVNLPWYTAGLYHGLQACPAPIQEFVRLWTSEEDQHATLLETYLLLSDNGDPAARARARKAVIAAGWTHQLGGPFEGMVYTAIQEAATRTFYLCTARACDREDPRLAEALRRIARDETLHMAFYRDVVRPTSIWTRATSGRWQPSCLASRCHGLRLSLETPRSARRTSLRMACSCSPTTTTTSCNSCGRTGGSIASRRMRKTRAGRWCSCAGTAWSCARPRTAWPGARPRAAAAPDATPRRSRRAPRRSCRPPPPPLTDVGSFHRAHRNLVRDFDYQKAFSSLPDDPSREQGGHSGASWRPGLPSSRLVLKSWSDVATITCAPARCWAPSRRVASCLPSGRWHAERSPPPGSACTSASGCYRSLPRDTRAACCSGDTEQSVHAPSDFLGLAHALARPFGGLRRGSLDHRPRDRWIPRGARRRRWQALEAWAGRPTLLPAGLGPHPIEGGSRPARAPCSDLDLDAGRDGGERGRPVLGCQGHSIRTARRRAQDHMTSHREDRRLRLSRRLDASERGRERTSRSGHVELLGRGLSGADRTEANREVVGLLQRRDRVVAPEIARDKRTLPGGGGQTRGNSSGPRLYRRRSPLVGSVPSPEHLRSPRSRSSS